MDVIRVPIILNLVRQLQDAIHPNFQTHSLNWNSCRQSNRKCQRSPICCMAGSRFYPTPVIFLFPAHQVFTGLSFTSNNAHAGWPCHCGTKYYKTSAVLHHIPPGSAAPRRSEPVFFAHLTHRLPDVCLEPALQLGADCLEKPGCRLDFINLIPLKFPNGMTNSFAPKTIISLPKSRSKFASATSLSASPCALRVTTSNLPPVSYLLRGWCSPPNRSSPFSPLPRTTAPIPAT